MTRFKRTMAFGSVALILAAGLTSCSPGEPGAATIRVWTPYPEMYDLPLQAVAAAYEDDHPGVTIKLESAPYQGAWDALQTQFLGSSAPDVMLLEPPIITDYSARGNLLSLTDELDGQWTSTFGDGYVDSLRAQDGNDYAVPAAVIHIKQQYLPSVYEAVGIEPVETYGENLKNLQKIKDAGLTGEWYAVNTGSAFLWWRYTLMLNAALRVDTDDINLRAADGWGGYDPSDPASIAGEAYTADEKYVAFVNGITDPVKNPIYREALDLLEGYKPFSGDTNSWTPEDYDAEFLKGQLAHHLGGDGDIIALQAKADDLGLGALDIKTVPLPAVTEDDWPALTDGPSNPLAAVRNGWSINAETKVADQSIDFVRYLSSVEGQDLLYGSAFDKADDDRYTIGQPSAVTGVTYPDGSGLFDEKLNLVPELSVYGFGSPPTYDNQDFDEFNNQLAQLWNGEIDEDKFLELRSASNLAALERNLEVYSSEIDQKFIDENTK